MITIGGPPNARTLPSGERWYTWRGRELLSVTTARQLVGLPWPLHQWQIGRVIDAAFEMAPAMLQTQLIPNAAEQQAQRLVVRAQLRTAATSERDAAALRGTSVHGAIAAGLLPSQVPPDLHARVAHYWAWRQQSGAQVLASEFQVWNLTVGYAGTADLLCRFPNGQMWLVDVKTGKGIYGDMAMQVVAYANAEFVGRDDVVDHALTMFLRNLSGLAILHLTDEGWTFNVIRWDWATWVAYRGMLAVAYWLRLHDSKAGIVVAAKSGKAADTGDGLVLA